MYSLLTGQDFDTLSAADLKNEIALARFCLERKLSSVENHRKKAVNDKQLQFKFDFDCVETTGELRGDKFNNDSNTLVADYGERSIREWIVLIASLVKRQHDIGGGQNIDAIKELFSVIGEDRGVDV